MDEAGGMRRRQWVPLLLLASGLGAYVAIEKKLPHDHEVDLDFGLASSTITDVELVWVPAGRAEDESVLTTRWHFAQGTAPHRLHTTVRLADGAWTADVSVGRAGTNETTRWSGQVNLEGHLFGAGPTSQGASLVLPVRQTLR